MTDPNVASGSVPSQSSAQPSPAGTAAPLTAAEDRQWAMLAHFLNVFLVIPAVVIFALFKDRGERVAVESKEALNWTINVAGVVIVLNVANVILGFVPVLGAIAWIVITILIWAVLAANLVFAIMGGLKVKDGGSYRYPLNHRWIT